MGPWAFRHEAAVPALAVLGYKDAGAPGAHTAMRTFTLSLLFGALLACGRTNLPCEPLTCAGCCDALGTCRPGDVNEECGASAKACVVCAKGATCTGGLCLGQAPATGGGGAMGGGRAGGGSGGAGGGVEPTARTIAARTFVPDVMIVLDRSGSMLQPEDPTSPACRGCTTSCPPGCQTRAGAVQAALGDFLMRNGGAPEARLGLVQFPSNASCGAPTAASPAVPDSDDGSVLAMHASAAASQLGTATFSGGTPTSLAVRFAANEPTLTADARREHFLFLVTDGLPNCNPSNAATCMAPQACRCTIGTGCVGQNCTTGCLDRQATLDALVFARQRGVRTVVVGLGPEPATMEGVALFNELAEAGELPLSCPGGSALECDSRNVCLPDRTCARKFSRDVASGVARLEALIRPSRRCRYVLEEAVAQAPGLEVRVNGLVVPRGSDGWQPDGTRALRFGGSVCALLLANTSAPVAVTLFP